MTTREPVLPVSTLSAANFLAIESLRAVSSHPFVHSFPQGAIVMFDRDLRYLCAGGLALADVGLSQEMMEGKTIFEVFPPEFVAIIEPQYRLALRGVESAVDVAYAGRIYLQRLGPVRDADGDIVAGMGFTQEVTEARRSERASRESEERVRLAFEDAPIGNALMSIDGRCVQVNRAMCDITGYTAVQMRSLPMSAITHPDDLAADLAVMHRLLSGEVRTATMDKRYRTPAGKIVWASKSTWLMRREDGSPMYFMTQVQDITERREHEQILAEERRRLREAESLGQLGSWAIDIASHSVTWSEGLFDLYGVDPREVGGDFGAMLRCIHPDDRARVDAAVEACARGEGPLSIRYRVIRARDGALRWFDARGEAIFIDGRVHHVDGAVTDVTEHVSAEAAARQAHAFQQAVISASPDIIFVYDVGARSTVWTNRSLSDQLGYGPDAGGPTAATVPGPPGGGTGGTGAAADVIRGRIPEVDRAWFDASLAVACGAAVDDVVSLHHRMRHADGTHRWFSRRTTPLERDADGVITQLVGVMRDITDAMVIERRLQHAALHDHLTGLPNRALLLDRLDGALTRSQRDGHEVAILFCDLDGFKRVNDTAGHSAGDAVLIETARRLREALREEDTVARVGGDEFVVLVEPRARAASTDALGSVPQEPDPGRELATGIAERIIGGLRRPIRVDGVEHVVSVSIGITYGGTPARSSQARTLSADQVLQNADAAMYRAKSLGKDRFEVFEAAMRADQIERGRVEQTLRLALRSADGPSDDALRLTPAQSPPRLTAVYQPIFDSGTDALVGFEALARLTDADGHAVPPDEFIPVAEDIGLIRPLGALMLELACGQLAQWRAQTDGLAAVTMAVNVSARQAQDLGLGEQVREVLDGCGLAPHDLVLELTETALLQAAESTITALQVLREQGVGIAIDDFGTGYASLRYLATLPVSALKIDRSFTSGLPTDKTSTKIVLAVAGLAADLDLTCVVEGVETAAQRAALPDGVHLQGWLTGRPLPPAALDLPDLVRRGAG